MDLKYVPYEKREPDTQYKNLIEDILKNGRIKKSPMVDKNGNEIRTLELIGATLRYEIQRTGVPFITERSIEKFWKSAVGEIFAFVNGARTQKELEEFGCKWWKYWVTEEKCAKRGLEKGDLGPGSYGAAFADFPTVDGKNFNQFKEIIQQMKERPELKTHIITPWIPNYTIRNSNHQQKVVVAPCHGWMHFHIFDDKLSMTMWQRSCDVLIGGPSNMSQYTAIFLAMAEVLDLDPLEFVWQISNAHMYENQLPWKDKILKRETKPLPTLKLLKKPGKDYKDIFKYRNSDFELTDYDPGEPIKDIPVGI